MSRGLKKSASLVLTSLSGFHVPQPYAASFLVRKWRFHSLLAVGNPLLTIRLIQIIENVFGFRQHDVPILEDRNIVLA